MSDVTFGSAGLPAVWILALLVVLVALVAAVIHLRRRSRHLVAAHAREQRRRVAAQARLNEVVALLDVSNLLNLYADRQRLLDVACRRLCATFDADLAAVLLVDDRQGVLELAASHGPRAADLAGMRVAVGEGLVGRIAHYRKGGAVVGHHLNAPGHRAEAALRSVPRLLLVPMRVRARITGIVLIGGGRELARKGRLSVLSLFAERLGWALERRGEIDRLRQRVGVLEQANRELVEVNRKGEVFLATATHELRTPLSGIVSYAEVLADYYDTMQDAERRPLCRELNEQCRTMMGLVDELFDFARLESGRLTLDPEETRIGELVASAIDLMEPKAQERGIAVERRLEADIPIMLDPTKIRQCVLNLLSNAIKFTEAQGTITVASHLAGDRVRVTVRDTGRGIDPEEIDRIFELYRSTAGAAKARAKGEKGLGLGLYLVKSFIELHGGEIQVRSAPGEGSTFCFTLPRHPDRKPADEDSARAA